MSLSNVLMLYHMRLARAIPPSTMPHTISNMHRLVLLLVEKLDVSLELQRCFFALSSVLRCDTCEQMRYVQPGIP